MIRTFVVFFAVATVGPAHAQSIPRTLDGRPDFHGAWESRWLTPLERPAFATGPTVSASEAEAFARQVLERMPTHITPPEDYDIGALLPAGDGAFRTSLIIDPPDGRQPLPEAVRSTITAAGANLGRTGGPPPDGPEARPPMERCLAATGRAPLGIVPANMFRRIVQTPDYVVIHSEFLDETRIIALDGSPRPPELISWTGDSLARWEGDTLVVETHRMRRDRPPPPNAPPGERVVTERFRLTSPDEIDYRYTVEDRSTLTGPFTVQFTLLRTRQPMFEGSCHEANYALANMLKGAREAERRAARK